MLRKIDKYFRTAPKSYYAVDWDSNDFKRSSKGVQKRHRLSYEDYKGVIYDDRVVMATNISIRLFQGQMSTVEAVSYTHLTLPTKA